MVDNAAFGSELKSTASLTDATEVHSGWLTKQGGNYKTWKKRWFSVRGYQMLYYKEPNDGKPLGVITLAYPLDKEGILTREVAQLPETSDVKRPHCFIIKGRQAKQRTYMLSAESAEEVAKWIDVIIGVIFSPKGGGMFGCPLEKQILKEGVGPEEIPKIVKACTDHIAATGLEEHGLFRLSGRQSRISELRRQFDMAEFPDVSKEPEIHAVTGLLKRYLRELPDPLLTAERFDTIQGAATVYNQNEQEGLLVLKQLVRDLPCANAHLLHHMCKFLSKVATHQEVNKMTTKNLAVVFAPSFMKSPEGTSESVIFSSHSDIELVTRVFIENHETLFELIPRADEDDWAPFKEKEKQAGNFIKEEFDLEDEDDIISGGGPSAAAAQSHVTVNRRRSMSAGGERLQGHPEGRPMSMSFSGDDINAYIPSQKIAQAANSPKNSPILPHRERSAGLVQSTQQQPKRPGRKGKREPGEPDVPKKPSSIQLQMATERIKNMSPPTNRKSFLNGNLAPRDSNSDNALLRERQLNKMLVAQIELLRKKNTELEKKLEQYEGDNRSKPKQNENIPRAQSDSVATPSRTTRRSKNPFASPTIAEESGSEDESPSPLAAPRHTHLGFTRPPELDGSEA